MVFGQSRHEDRPLAEDGDISFLGLSFFVFFDDYCNGLNVFVYFFGGGCALDVFGSS